MARERTLSHDEARRFYDAFGARQDTQAFYEDPPNRDLAAHCELESARRVLELGCGTGRFAAGLLESELPADATYHAIDQSETMVSLARQRLAPYASRVTVTCSDGTLKLPTESGSGDRFLSTYVLDLLSRDDIAELLREAHRVLAPAGLAGVTSLTFGRDPLGRVVSGLWGVVHRLSPRRVGGCRPLDLVPFFAGPQWRIEHEATHRIRGLTSQVVVARRRP